MGQQQITCNTGPLGSDGSLDTYDVPGSVIVTPYSVSATFDGSGAGGAFLPCLTFKTQTGAIIARCPAPEVVAGDTAEVSWFPHVASAAAGPAPSSGGVVSAATFFENQLHPQLFGPASGHVVHFTSANNVTNSSSVFSFPTTQTIRVASDGVFRVDGSISFNSNTGSPYVGQVNLIADIQGPPGQEARDLVDPIAYESEVFTTDVGDNLIYSGTSTWTIDPLLNSPPYDVQLTVDIDQTISLYQCALMVSLESATALT